MSRRLVLAALALVAVPAAAQAQAPFTVSGVPGIMARDTSYPLSVTLNPPFNETVKVCLKSNRGGVTFSPSEFTFAAGETGPKASSITTSSVTGQFAIGGQVVQTSTSCATATVSFPVFSWVQGKVLLTPTSGLMVVNTVRTLVVSLNMATPAGTTLGVDLGLAGEPATSATFSTTSLTFSGSTSQNITVNTGVRNGNLTVTPVLSGSAAAYYTAEPQVIPFAENLFASLFPCCIQVGGPANGPMTMTLSTPTEVPFDVNVLLSGAGSGGTTVTPQVLSFAAGEQTKNLSFLGGPDIGDVKVTFSSASPHVFTGSTYTLRSRGTVTVTNKPVSLNPGQTSGPITLTLSHPNLKTFTANVSISPNAVGASASPASMTFAPGEMTKTFTITAGPTTGQIGVGISLTPFVDAYFTPPAGMSIAVTTGTPTPAGLGVTITPAPEGNAPAATFTFQEVITGGLTRLIPITSPIAPPSGYEVPGTPLYFAIQSSALLSGDINACVSYANAQTIDPSGLRLYRWVAPGPWLNVTQSINTTTQQVCGTAQAGQNAPNTVQWAIFRPNTPPEVGTITGPAGIVAANAVQQFSATVFDVDDDDVLTATWMWGDGTTSPATITNNGENGIAAGEHAYATGGIKHVTLVVTDGANTVSSEVFIVTVDAAPPSINALTATPGFVWPPDNKMHAITLTVDASDDTGTPVCTITNVTEASGSKQAAFAITGALTFEIKAHPHTAYTATVTCSDALNRTSTKSVTVKIEHVK